MYEQICSDMPHLQSKKVQNFGYVYHFEMSTDISGADPGPRH